MVCKRSLLACRLSFHTVPFSFANAFVFDVIVFMLLFCCLCLGGIRFLKNHHSYQCYVVFLQFLKIVPGLMFKFLIVDGIFSSETHNN